MHKRVLAAFLAALLGCSPATPVQRTAPAADVLAIRYGTLRNFQVSALLAGADTARRMDAALMVWLVRHPSGRNILVDAGFHREKFMQRWKPTDYVKPSEAVQRAGVRPEDITDIIVSHVHWDHADGADLFPKARIWIQREEMTHHVDGSGRALDRAIDSLDAAMLHDLQRNGRVVLLDGDDQEVAPGVRVYIGGKHTLASQYVGVATTEGTVVIASDNAYLYENFDKRVPIAQTLDAASNLRAQDRMRAMASHPRLLIPGHDPEIFTRFPSPGNGVARIR